MLCFSRFDSDLPGALSGISIFTPLSTSAYIIFHIFSSVEVNLDDGHPLATFDSDNIFSSQFRDVMAERRESEGSKIMGKW